MTLAAYLAVLHDAGRASASASSAVAAACFHAKLAGEPPIGDEDRHGRLSRHRTPRARNLADSLSLRSFLDLELTEAAPDHSTLSRTRRRIDVETHEAVFTWVLERLSAAGLVRGKTVGIDATTLEANAAMRSIERRDTGESHEEFIRRLAEASGVETPTRAELARFDRSRKAIRRRCRRRCRRR